MIFVFGSNLAGIHGVGAAAYAVKHHGAKYGVYEGIQGNAYAIPTKDAQIKETLPLLMIQGFVNTFIDYTKAHPDTGFQITCIGCGLAGLSNDQVAPMFRRAEDRPNCFFDTKWRPWLGDKFEYWGTF